MPRRPGSGSSPTDALPDVVLARDVPVDTLREARRAGAVERVGHGVYLRSPQSPESQARAARRRALAHVIGSDRRLTGAHVFSHDTAALLWGLPLWRAPARTSVYVGVSPGGSGDPRIVRHIGVPPDRDVRERFGMRVTSLERTLVDCAQTLPPLEALVVADAALRAGAQPTLVAALLAERVGRRGVVRAREVVQLADDGAESPGETATRFVLLRDGWPAPTTQLPIATRLGTFWADLGFPELRLAFEYDGRVKYEDPEALMREKRRHDAVVEAGVRLFRVTREDLRSGTLSMRATAALGPADRPVLSPRRLLH